MSAEPPAFPKALDDDDDDVAWALQTAAVQWERGGHADAVVWLRRAAQAAVEAGEFGRAADLERGAREVEGWVERGVVGPAPSEDNDDGVESLLGLAPELEVRETGHTQSLVDALELEAHGAAGAGADALDEISDVEDLGDVVDVQDIDGIDVEALEAVEPEDLTTPSGDALNITADLEATASDEPVFQLPPPPFPRLPPLPKPPPAKSAKPTSRRRSTRPSSSHATRRAPEEAREAAPPSSRSPRSSRSAPISQRRPGPASVAAEVAPESEVPAVFPAAETPSALPPVEAPSVAPMPGEVLVAGEPNGAQAAPTPPPPASDEPGDGPTLTRRKVTDVAAAMAELAVPRGIDVELVAACRGLEDLPPETQVELAARARVEELSAEQEVGGFGLALVLRGSVAVMPKITEATCGRADQGEPVFTTGSLAEGVALRAVALGDGAQVAVWQAEDFERAFETCPWVLEELRLVADRYQALAGVTMGLLGERLDDTMRAMVTERASVRWLEPGEVLLERGKAVAGLNVVGGGRLELVEGDAVGQELGPGDLPFASAVLSHAPAPATLRAGAQGALVLHVDRMTTHELLVSVPPLLELLAMA